MVRSQALKFNKAKKALKQTFKRSRLFDSHYTRRLNMLGTLIGIAALGGYGYGAWRFWKGFHRTNFTQNRLVFTALWPLFLTNKSYRKNFNKALKG
jgi:hypothetical protein